MIACMQMDNVLVCFNWSRISLCNYLPNVKMFVFVCVFMSLHSNICLFLLYWNDLLIYHRFR